MPIHDWTRVTAGIFHHFYHRWITEISDALNAGLLPSGLYAMAEQVTGDIGPDVLTLQLGTGDGEVGPDSEIATAVAEAPPKGRFTARTEMDQYVLKQNSIVIRHSSGDEVIALIEIVSPGNKGSRKTFRMFIEKAAAILYHGYHLTVLDLQPPGRRDPNGIHGALWEEIADEPFRLPADKPLTLASYDAGPPKTAYIEPVAVGDRLPEMPLFLEPGRYINLPLDSTYENAWKGVPQRWRRVLEGVAS